MVFLQAKPEGSRGPRLVGGCRGAAAALIRELAKIPVEFGPLVCDPIVRIFSSSSFRLVTEVC